MKYIKVLVILTIISSCKKEIKNDFKFPVIWDIKNNGNYYYSPQSMVLSKGFIYSCQPIKDTIKFTMTEKRVDEMGSIFNSREKIDVKYYSNSGFKICIDTTNELSEDKQFLLNRFFPLIIDSITNEVDNNSVWVANEIYRNLDSVFIKAYPVYLVNNSDSSTLISNIDNRLTMIQEAKDKTGKWRPIEYWQCGCQYSTETIILKPNFLISTKIYIYKGSFKTELRLKIKNGTRILYSKPFIGTININQFNLPLKWKDISYEQLQKLTIEK